MSKISKTVKEERTVEKLRPVKNFMDGVSYEMDPLLTLKMVTASSIFGEPQYYRNGMKSKSYIKVPEWVKDELIVFSDEKTDTFMETIIDEALDYDFGKTIEFASVLRNEYNMRLNPQVIMVRASKHPKRIEYNIEHPGKFAEIQTKVMSRADEPSSQLAYYLYAYKNKNNMPSCLKRSWAKKLESLSRYEIAKYKNAELGMIDTVRVCHANSDLLNELMSTGTIEIEETEKTWENLKSEGKNWEEILNSGIKIGHMAALRNLRGIASDENVKPETLKKFLDDHFDEKSVLKGKQFPFRYWSAYKAIEDSYCNHKVLLLETLEKAMNYSLKNMPKLPGKTMILSDNSGSAWGTFNSEFGTVRVAEIGNLSAVLTAMNSEEGYVGVFGDRLTTVPILKTSSIFDNLKKVNEAGRHVGGGTENGIWLFFDKTIEEKEHWDNLFIYSDMQAGHGGLYGISGSMRNYKSLAINSHTRGTYIDVLALLRKYRSVANKNINVYSVQTAGYNNNVLPENLYRTAILYGWTGKELCYADEINKLWDDISR